MNSNLLDNEVPWNDSTINVCTETAGAPSMHDQEVSHCHRPQEALAAASVQNKFENVGRSERRLTVTISPTSRSLTSTAGCNHEDRRTLVFSEPDQLTEDNQVQITSILYKRSPLTSCES